MKVKKFKWLPGGELILTLDVADTAEVKGWILGFGQEAEVLEPTSLRQEIRAEAKGLLQRLEVSDALRQISAEQLTLPVMGAA
jgi:predicted DNA-binding transcriptional regulator YafY